MDFGDPAPLDAEAEVNASPRKRERPHVPRTQVGLKPDKYPLRGGSRHTRKILTDRVKSSRVSTRREAEGPSDWGPRSVGGDHVTGTDIGQALN
jgi:hypothetical protein